MASTGTDGRTAGPPGETPGQAAELAEHLRLLGEALVERTDDVVARMLLRTKRSGSLLDDGVEEHFARVGSTSAVAVARWMAGEGIEAARQVGEESWPIFGQLAARRDAPLNELVKRCLRWSDAAGEVVGEIVGQLGLSEGAHVEALSMLKRSLHVTLVRMCESFEVERQHTDDQLNFLATHDSLTGLPSRTLIVDRIEQMLVRSRHNQTPVAALFIDLDNFKGINDTLGHDVGDELLCAVAARLDGVVRDVDALGRLGGDEFVVVASELSLAGGPVPIAERLLDALKQPFKLTLCETSLTVTASVGIAVGERISAAELLRNADVAMYRAKHEGKNGFVVYESAMQDAVLLRLQLEADLQSALEGEEFFLVYQPTFDLQSMRPTGVEALIRWRHPAHGVVEPGSFIGLLEETGLICEVGAWVLKEATSQGARWHADGHDVGISVNVAARQLDSDAVITQVQEALAESGLDPHALIIEVAEIALMRNAAETVRRLSAIKALGVRIAIDDFGTGYSSLAHLQKFPVDALKIDRSFITGMGATAEGETLMHTLIQVGKSLSIETLAEGIEQPDELSLLQSEQCDGGQGFLLAHPLDAAGTEALLRTWAAGQAPIPTPAL